MPSVLRTILAIAVLVATKCPAAEPAGAVAASAKPRATIGAYYFDGWSGKTDQWHLPKLLETEYAHRKPVWGWWDNTADHHIAESHSEPSTGAIPSVVSQRCSTSGVQPGGI